MRALRLALACCALTAGAALATTPPPAPPAGPKSTKLTSVYNLAHAGAILDICAASPGASADAARAKEIAELAGRLSALVKAMGGHYRDAELAAIYDSTRAQMAADARLQRHVHEAHRDCAERSLSEMRTYVADNEAMIREAIERSRQKAAPRAPAPK